MTQTDEFEIDLIRVFKALWKKAWAIVLCIVILGGGVFIYGEYSYVPQYAAKVSMYIRSKLYVFEDHTCRVTPPTLSDARALVTTCGAMLKTRSVLEKVIDTAGVNKTAEELSSMIAVGSIDKTELFSVTVTSKDPEEAARIANAITQVLPEKMAAVNGVYMIHVVDSALVPEKPVSTNIGRTTFLATLLGAMLVCAVIVIADIWAQWKAWDPRFQRQEKA